MSDGASAAALTLRRAPRDAPRAATPPHFKEGILHTRRKKYL